MSARNRESVERQPGSHSRMTYTEFIRLFPDDAACLDYLKERFYPDGMACPKCGKTTKFHRIKTRSVYGCQFCGHQVYPTANTIFHKSSTSLHLWFWAIFLLSSSKCGISAKQLEREIGVTYKTAWRMFNVIRNKLLVQDDDEPLSGEVEADETYVGGKARAWPKRTRAEHLARKTTVFAAVERKGRVRATVVPDNLGPVLRSTLRKFVMPASILYTDYLPAYNVHEISSRYHHRRIPHHANVYVMGDVHTQTIEGFFGLFKTSVRGAHHSISAKWLQGYLNEYVLRYNHRKDERPIFWTILDRVAKNAGLQGA
jgi:transposase